MSFCMTGLVDGPSSWVMLNQDRQSRALVANGTQLYLLDHGGQFQELHPPVSTAQTFQVTNFLPCYLSTRVDHNLLKRVCIAKKTCNLSYIKKYFDHACYVYAVSIQSN